MRHEGVCITFHFDYVLLSVYFVLKETKYSCPHCDYQSIQSTSYKNHVAAKHPGKGGTFYCSACSYHTVSETAFFNHKLEHSKNKGNANHETS